jgi:hypothetical protein
VPSIGENGTLVKENLQNDQFVINFHAQKVLFIEKLSERIDKNKKISYAFFENAGTYSLG